MATRARAGVGDLEFESLQSQSGLKIKTPGLKLASLLVRVGSIRHQHLPEREADDSRRVVAGGRGRRGRTARASATPPGPRCRTGAWFRVASASPGRRAPSRAGARRSRAS